MSEFFSSCQVENVRLVRDRIDERPKGFGYVEFKTKEGLIAAVNMSGESFCGRGVKISVAEPRMSPLTMKPPAILADSFFYREGSWR